MYNFSMSETKEETLWFANIWNMQIWGKRILSVQGCTILSMFKRQKKYSPSNNVVFQLEPFGQMIQVAQGLRPPSRQTSPVT